MRRPDCRLPLLPRTGPEPEVGDSGRVGVSEEWRTGEPSCRGAPSLPCASAPCAASSGWRLRRHRHRLGRHRCGRHRCEARQHCGPQERGFSRPRSPVPSTTLAAVPPPSKATPPPLAAASTLRDRLSGCRRRRHRIERAAREKRNNGSQEVVGWELGNWGNLGRADCS